MALGRVLGLGRVLSIAKGGPVDMNDEQADDDDEGQKEPEIDGGFHHQRSNSRT